MTNDLKSILAFMLGASAMSPDGGYGGKENKTLN